MFIKLLLYNINFMRYIILNMFSNTSPAKKLKSPWWLLQAMRVCCLLAYGVCRIRYELWFAELERKQHNFQRGILLYPTIFSIPLIVGTIIRVSPTWLARSKYSGSEMLQGFELDVQNLFLHSRLDWLFNFHIFLYNLASFNCELIITFSPCGVPFFGF